MACPIWTPETSVIALYFPGVPVSNSNMGPMGPGPGMGPTGPLSGGPLPPMGGPMGPGGP